MEATFLMISLVYLTIASLAVSLIAKWIGHRTSYGMCILMSLGALLGTMAIYYALSPVAATLGIKGDGFWLTGIAAVGAFAALVGTEMKMKRQKAKKAMAVPALIMASLIPLAILRVILISLFYYE